MNGRIQWNWFIWGKHPGISDFISVGKTSHLFQSFTKWVDTGFSMVDAALKEKSRHCSWRFWTKGAAGEIVCGLVRNSCDSYGRSFPLLCLGTGALQNWALNRSLLPYALEPVWKHFEYLAATRCDSVSSVSEALQLIEPPSPSWQRYQERIHSTVHLYAQKNSEEHAFAGKRLFKMNCLSPECLPLDLRFCSGMIALDGKNPPTAVFIGETGGQVAVAMIGGVLKPTDFEWLWSLQSE